jgi:hypothetical protein
MSNDTTMTDDATRGAADDGCPRGKLNIESQCISRNAAICGGNIRVFDVPIISSDIVGAIAAYPNAPYRLQNF